MQFLTAMKARDFVGAKVLAFRSACPPSLATWAPRWCVTPVGAELTTMLRGAARLASSRAVLTDDPDNDMVWKALPIINKQLAAQEGAPPACASSMHHLLSPCARLRASCRALPHRAYRAYRPVPVTRTREAR